MSNNDKNGGDGDHTSGRFYGWPSSRIVRVSRATGGKDRHSKVLTSKGLRDRRVRLSVNTAIQFYDLQDRLGYDQPSKAVEWLLKAAASSIADLPPVSSPFPERKSSGDEMAKMTKLPSAARSGSRIKDIKERVEENTTTSFTELLNGGLNGNNMKSIDNISTDNYFSGGLLGPPGQMYPLQNYTFASDMNFGAVNRGTLQSNSSSSSPAFWPHVRFNSTTDLYDGDDSNGDKGKGKMN